MKNSTPLVTLGLALRAVATDPLTLESVEADINTDELQRDLWNLNHIADINGGNRAAGQPGYDASVDFVLERAQVRFAPEMDTWVQPFNKSIYMVGDIALTGPEGEDVYVVSPTQNIGGVVTGELADTLVNDEQGSMCEESDWESVDVIGKIALVKRGVCGFVTKVEYAASYGAVGIMMYNYPENGTDFSGPDLGAPEAESIVPIGIVTQEQGNAWKARLIAGETLAVTLDIDATVTNKTINNVIAETKEGDPNSVIMLGAHLDSVIEGPGVNDDGSGTSGLLEIMGSFRKYVGFPNKVRFGWWGAEEDGLVGSLYYASQLTPEEADKIKFFFDYDMIGSIEPRYWVYADNGTADEIGAQEIWEYIASTGKTPEWYGAYTNDSDYVGFRDLGIPVSGIFTGAGAPEDPCYHQACDTRDNINYEAITINTKAAARAAAKLALSTEGLPLRKRSVPVGDVRQQRRQMSPTQRRAFFSKPRFI